MPGNSRSVPGQLHYLSRESINIIQAQIDGDTKRFRGPVKTVDNTAFRSGNCLALYCRYPISDKIAKKGKPPK
jgi:hypothetical protein